MNPIANITKVTDVVTSPDCKALTPDVIPTTLTISSRTANSIGSQGFFFCLLHTFYHTFAVLSRGSFVDSDCQTEEKGYFSVFTKLLYLLLSSSARLYSLSASTLATNING